MHSTDDITKEFIALKSEVAQVKTLFDRLDVTIEKLTEVSTTVSQLLAVQGNRLEQQEKSNTQLSLLIEKRKDETAESVEALHQRINSAEKDFKAEIEKLNTKLFEEMKALREDSKRQHDALDKKITEMQKWIWIVSGGATVIGFLLSTVIDVNKFFG